MQTRTKRWILWIAILLIAAILRLPGANWDAGFALHPDERYLVDLSRRITVYENPCLVDPHYPYGHFPLYLLSPITPNFAHVDPLFSARLFSGILGVLLVAVTGAAGRILARGEDSIGWGAAFALSFAPLLIQNARFYTVDIIATLTVTVSVWAAIRKRWSLSGLCGALAVGSKLSYIWVWPFLLIVLCFDHQILIKNKINQHKFMNDLFGLLFWGGFAYLLGSPWMIIAPKQCWSGPFVQIRMATGAVELPYTLQYYKTIPYLYHIKQMAIWGLGPVCVLFGIVGLFVKLFRWRAQNRTIRIIILWVLIYGVAMGGLYTKFPRYLMPLYPWIVLLAFKTIKSTFISHSHKKWWLTVTCFSLIPTILMGIAQANIYQSQHPWISASQWILNNTQSDANIVFEAWEYPLPLLDKPNTYFMSSLPVYEDESKEKLLSMDELYSQGDVFVIGSRRAYGALSRNAIRFQETMAWYADHIQNSTVLFFSICPHIGPLSISDDPLLDNHLPVKTTLADRCGTPYVLRLPKVDESYRVYDSPTTLILLSTDD